MNTAVPMVWRMGPKYGLQESSRLTSSDRLRSDGGDGASVRPASMLAAAQAIAVAILLFLMRVIDVVA